MKSVLDEMCESQNQQCEYTFMDTGLFLTLLWNVNSLHWEQHIYAYARE